MAFQENIKMRKTKQYRAKNIRELIIGLELVIHSDKNVKQFYTCVVQSCYYTRSLIF